MSDDEKDFGMCEYCKDERGLCDRNFLVDGRRFSIKLDETFEVDTLSHFVNYYLNAKLMLHLLQLIILIFYNSTSLSPVMQESMSLIRLVLVLWKVWR